jgi:hypothetical protein
LRPEASTAAATAGIVIGESCGMMA